MDFTSEASIAVLEYALKREKESLDFYTKCHEKACIEGTKEILAGLVADEERHAEIVTGMLAKARAKKDAIAIDMKQPVSAKDALEKAFPHMMVDHDSFAAESATVGDMLAQALENEKESYTNYAKAAKDASEQNLKEIYTFLAEEEKKHFTVIDNLIDYLDDPGKWLYTEENIIFNL